MVSQHVFVILISYYACKVELSFPVDRWDGDLVLELTDKETVDCLPMLVSKLESV